MVSWISAQEEGMILVVVLVVRALLGRICFENSIGVIYSGGDALICLAAKLHPGLCGDFGGSVTSLD